MPPSRSIRVCITILANGMEVRGVRNFHCDFLEGKVDGLAKSTLQFLRRRVETFQNFPLGPFRSWDFFSGPWVGHRPVGIWQAERRSPKPFILVSASVFLIYRLWAVQLKILHMNETRHSGDGSYKFKFKTHKNYFSPLWEMCYNCKSGRGRSEGCRWADSVLVLVFVQQMQRKWNKCKYPRWHQWNKCREKIQTSDKLLLANLGLRFCHVKVALCLFLCRWCGSSDGVGTVTAIGTKQLCFG